MQDGRGLYPVNSKVVGRVWFEHDLESWTAARIARYTRAESKPLDEESCDTN
jgi:hypothetical protein